MGWRPIVEVLWLHYLSDYTDGTFFLFISSVILLSTGQISVFLMPPLGGTKVRNQPVSYLLYTTSASSHFPMSHCFLLDVPMDTSASHLCQGVPASPVIAMATWTYPYLAAVIQSLASVCAVDRAMAAPIATVALKGTMETPSRQKAASVSKQTSNLSVASICCCSLNHCWKKLVRHRSQSQIQKWKLEH